MYINVKRDLNEMKLSHHLSDYAMELCINITSKASVITKISSRWKTNNYAVARYSFSIVRSISINNRVFVN